MQLLLKAYRLQGLYGPPAALLAGDVGVYATMGEGWRLFCCALMLLGRLEVFSFLFVIQTLASRWEGRW